MFKIKIVEKENILGYFCGFFNRQEGKQCGYEDDINNTKVKSYKLRRNAENAINDLKNLYGTNSPYNFEIVEV